MSWIVTGKENDELLGQQPHKVDMTTKKLLTITPFKIGCLVLLLSAGLFFSFGDQKPPLLDNLDSKLGDAMFHLRGPQPASGQVVIVDIDEKSLAEIGQWPWPRDIIALLIENIGSAGAAAIGFDMVFPEPDRSSPGNIIRQLQQKHPKLFVSELPEESLLDHDIILGETISVLPSVLGYVFQLMDDGMKDEFQAPFPTAEIRVTPQAVPASKLRLHSAYRPILNVPEISMALSEGFFNVFPDNDSIVRKVPLLMELDGMPYPSLALELARIGIGEDTLWIHAEPRAHRGQHDMIGVSVGEHFIPTDERGQISVNFRGPSFSFPYISASDVLNGIEPERFADKIVLIGTSAAGLLDLRAIPFDNVYPGVEVHANVVDNIISLNPIKHDTYTELTISWLMITFGGLLLAGLLAYGGAITGGLGTLVLLLLAVAGNYYFFFLQNVMIGMVYPLATLLLQFMVVTLFNYFHEGRQKRFISKAFSQYVPPELVEEMAEHPEDLGLKGESREMSVLFSDVRGFTTISEGLEASELTLLMNELLTPMTRVIHQNRGTIDKYMGDAIMAFWGAPLNDPNHAANAMKAGLELLASLPQLQKEFAARGWPKVKIGVGINSGMMNVGNMGSEFRMAYTVLGDAVNLGSRLEGLTKQYGVDIMVSEYTKEKVPGYIYRELDKVRVKGKKKPVTIFEPLGLEGEVAPDRLSELELYHSGIKAYREKCFNEALGIFNELKQQHKSVLLYQLYSERCEVLLANPPEEYWDGSFTHTSK